MNLLVTLLSGNVTSPFAGGERKPSVTLKHRPLVWECMLGTVYARDPKTGKVLYCDYDYSKAHAHARVKECTDLRICKNGRDRTGRDNSPLLRNKQVALWGVFTG